MSYLLTNASAMTALQNLAATQQSLSTTQSQLSTGLSIQTAADNASYWSIAQTMQSDNGALKAVSSALNVQSSMLSTFTSGLTQSISVVNQIKNELVQAQQPGANLTQIGKAIAAQQDSLVSISKGATFNNQNWLTTTAATTTLINSYTNATGVNTLSVSTGGISLVQGVASGAASSSATGGILGTAGANLSTLSILSMVVNTGSSVTASAGATSISAMLADVNSIITKMEDAAAALGAATNSTSTEATFIASMQTNLSNGVAALVDADMNEASTRLQALQTQQQLGVQSLSIANQNSQMILKLFQ